MFAALLRLNAEVGYGACVRPVAAALLRLECAKYEKSVYMDCLLARYLSLLSIPSSCLILDPLMPMPEAYFSHTYFTVHVRLPHPSGASENLHPWAALFDTSCFRRVSQKGLCAPIIPSAVAPPLGCTGKFWPQG
eukprot:scaffold34814_cov22-Tisochrysis_lutea.AAC.1